MSPRFTARNRVAIAGYAQSPIVRHADRSLGAIAVEAARAAIADAGLTVTDVDGFTTGALLPSAGGHASVDGVSVVTSNWLAEALGVNPRFAAGFQGYGQIPGSVALAVNAVATGAADVVLLHRALHNPPRGRYHVNEMTHAPGGAQWTAPQGFWGPLSMIALPYNEYLQRYGASRESMANVVVEARANGARTVLGHLAILDTKPMPPALRCEALFRIFAERAAAEVQRLRAEAATRAKSYVNTPSSWR